MIHERIIRARGGLHNAFMHTPGPFADPRSLIEELRTARGFTSARALAIAAGIPQPTLSRYLKGTSETMEVANFQALARVLDVTLSELLGEVPINSRPDVRELTRILAKLPEPERRAWIAAGKAMMDHSDGGKPKPD